MIDLASLGGRIAPESTLSDLKLLETLVRADVPLLVLAAGPPILPRSHRRRTSELAETQPPSKWLVSWCDWDAAEEPRGGIHQQQTRPLSSYIGFRVSEGRLAQFLENHLSLREAILHCEYGLYLYEAREPLHPMRVVELDPRLLPESYLPARDLALDGNEVFSLEQAGFDAPLKLGFHIISRDQAENQLSWATSGPFQTHFQRYLSWASHFIKRQGHGERLVLGHDDWTILNTRLAIGGSYRIFCSGSTIDPGESESVAGACQALKEATEYSARESTALDEDLSLKIGARALDDLYALLAFISAQGVAVTIRWGLGGTSGELALNKRVADRAIPRLRKLRERRPGEASLSVTLTAEEVEYLTREVRGQGGWQSSLRRIQSKLKGNTLTLTAEDVDRIVKQAQTYGQGGFQDRLQRVIQAIRRWETSFSGIE